MPQYFVINLPESRIVAEGSTYNEAAIMLLDEVKSSDGCYLEDDFAIMTEEELEDYGGI